jgi:23S rRNA (uracil1939-C5)-methyltransferase
VTSAELTLQEMAPGGEAVGRREDGLVVFVPGGAPGDRVEVAIEPPRKGHARGRLLRVLSPGAERVFCRCPLARPDKCGGCPLQPVARAAQLRDKESWVRRALRPSKLKSGAPVLPILAPTPDYRYRLRARLVLRNGKLGFASARSQRSVEIAGCEVLAAPLDRVLFGRCAALGPLLGEGALLQGLLGVSAGREAVQLALRPGTGAKRGAVRAALLKLLDEGEICGVFIDDGGASEWLGAAWLELGGAGEWGPFFGAADGFAQPSAAGHELLPALVENAVAQTAAELPRGARVLELYAGSGNLTRALRRPAEEVLCIEGDAHAVERLRMLFRQDPAVTVQAQAAAAALALLVGKQANFDVVVLDPPRTGARETVPFLSKLGARRIIYVSCDPMTLGRDLAELLQHASPGYLVRHVQPIDLSPHTAHVECVAIVDRC